MTRKPVNRVMLPAVVIPLLFVGTVAWASYAQIRHEALDRALIQEIKKQNAITEPKVSTLFPDLPEGRRQTYYTPFISSHYYSHREVEPLFRDTANRVRLLLNEGADPNAHDETGAAPLSFWGYLRFLLHLQKTTPRSGKPALILAMDANNTDIVKALLERGANPNVQDDNGVSPLHWSAWLSNPTITQMLLANGADTKNSECAVAVTTAAFYWNLATMKVLLDHGADVNGGRLVGWTALMCPIAELPFSEPKATAVEMVKLLLAYHADVNIRDARGDTALSLARYWMTAHQMIMDPVILRREIDEIIRLLKQHGAKE